MANDYGIFYQQDLSRPEDWAALPKWDVFLSSFNKSERLRSVYDTVAATNKLWLVHSEYNLGPGDLPSEANFAPDASDESSFVLSVMAHLQAAYQFDPLLHSCCIDITGLMRPHLMFLVRYLAHIGVRKFHAIYAEPIRYTKKEKTTFSAGTISEVRPVQGFEGSPEGDTSHDLLIIGMGYDDRMLHEVADDKDKADKIQLFGLPSLRADMYQESVIRSRAAADALGDPDFSERHRGFAPANDPFATASVLSEIVEIHSAIAPITNLYLSPLGTKAQALGFALFYIGERIATNTTITFPFSTHYEPETSTGFARAWCYTVEFPLL